MKKTNVILLILFFCSAVFSQTDIGPDTKLNMPGNWGIKKGEKPWNYAKQEESKIPDILLRQYAEAKLAGNESEKSRIGSEIQKFLEPSVPAPEGSYEPSVVTGGAVQPPFSADWYTSDVQIYSGNIAYAGGYRQLDMKYGEDGWLYLVLNKRPVTGTNGAISVYRSSNGGATWSSVGSVSNTSAYFGNVTMLVEKRHASMDDSVRVLVFYERSGASTFTDASMEMVSWRRDGSAAYINHFGTPTSGNKFEYPSACSDGMYWGTATYVHLIVREVTNAGSYVGLRHFLSTDWGITYTNVLINTSNNDLYPSAAYCEKGTGNDSIYIAVERRVTATEYEIRAIITCEWLTTNHFAYYITSATSGTKYEKPCINVQQQQASVPRRVMITCTKNNLARYHISTTGGQTWQVDGSLGTNGLADYTWCNSDSLTAGDGYAMACFVDQNGDSITVRRGNMTGSLGAYQYLRNSNMSTGMLAPVCAIYKSGTSKYAAFSYAGNGPTNIYFNQENLVTGVEPVSNIADRFELRQNYPNPFNPNTAIIFSIPKREFVKIAVYDVTGREVRILADGEMNSGTYKIDFDGAEYASGVYFYRLITADYTDVKKMILIK